jgi:hypothetical protein
MNAQTRSRIDLFARCNNVAQRAAVGFGRNQTGMEVGEWVQSLLTESEEVHRQKCGGAGVG